MPGMSGRETVIVDAVRLPVGRSHPERGYYRDRHPADLLGLTYVEVLRRAGADPGLVDLVIAGCVQQFGTQSYDIARNAWLQEGLPITASATTLDTQCGSGQQAVGFAASLVASGIHEVVVASGVEHMGVNPFSAGDRIHEEYGSPWTDKFFAQHDVRGQGIGAELVAADRGITRADVDAFSLESHRRAAAARDAGAFDREILPVATPEGIVRTDQGIRDDSSLEALAALRPVFREDGIVTAGGSSQVSDGAAAVLVASAEHAKELGLSARARIVDHLSVGCDPVRMLEGPIPATRKILERNGMTLDDIDIVEINEAFAPVVIAWQRELRADLSRVNPRGGAIALGHPLGSTGARLITTLLHELEDEDKEFGLVTMCCGGGIGTATLIQRVG